MCICLLRHRRLSGLPTHVGRVRVPLQATDRQAQLLAGLGATVKQGAAKLYEKRGRWYLALSISVQVTPCVGTKVAGVDPGLMNLAVVNCEGETLFFSGDRAAFVRRMGKAKALGAIRRMKNKEARWMKNQDHEISRKIVDWCIARGHVEHADSVGAANSAGAISGLAAA